MVKLITDNYCVDMSNIITSGFSWGGGMSYELACARANAADNTVGYAFRAAVIYEGALISGCDNGKDPIAIWQKVGLTDTTCPVSMATPIRDQFVKNNQCTGWTQKPERVGLADRSPQPRAASTALARPVHQSRGTCFTNYTGCTAGHPIRWCVDQSATAPVPLTARPDLYIRAPTAPKTCSTSCPCTWTPDECGLG